MIYITSIGVRHITRFSGINATDIELLPMHSDSVARIPHGAFLFIVQDAPWEIILLQPGLDLHNWHNTMLSLLRSGVQYNLLPLDDILSLALEHGVDLRGFIKYKKVTSILSSFILNYIKYHSPTTIDLYNDFIQRKYDAHQIYDKSDMDFSCDLEQYLEQEQSADVSRSVMKRIDTIKKKYDHIKFLDNVKKYQISERSVETQKFQTQKTGRKDDSDNVSSAGRGRNTDDSRKKSGAVREVKRHLSYRVGTIVFNNSCCPLFLFIYPFFMLKELFIYAISPKYQNIALFSDVEEARNIMKSMQYRFGQYIVSNKKNLLLSLVYPKKIITRLNLQTLSEGKQC